MKEYEHKLAMHPEVMVTRRAALRLYYTRYIPFAIGALVLAIASMLLHLWWWRFGFLAGIYGVFAILIAFGIREWKMEGQVRLGVSTACPICDMRLTLREWQPHLAGSHPDMWRLMRRSAWLLSPTLLALLGYLLVLVGIMIVVPLPDWIWGIIPVLVMGPIVCWMTVLAVVGTVLDQTRLQPARRSWMAQHPPRNP